MGWRPVVVFELPTSVLSLSIRKQLLSSSQNSLGVIALEFINIEVASNICLMEYPIEEKREQKTRNKRRPQIHLQHILSRRSFGCGHTGATIFELPHVLPQRRVMHAFVRRKRRTITHSEATNTTNGKKKKINFYKSLLIVYHPMDVATQNQPSIS